ncbi:glycosyltransferase family 4 protein [bacterium]|nr:glycosyltransferase family 4 protein [candidate division CSSED10-310 bacterium]
MIQVLFDARFITPERTGVGRVTENLLLHLLGNTQEVSLHVMYHDSLPNDLLGLHPVRVDTPFDSHPRGDLHRNIAIPRMMHERGIDLFFSPAFYSIQMRRGIPQVVLIHDLAVYDEAETVNPVFRLYLRNMIGSSVRNATVLTTPSEFIRQRIIDRFHVPDDRVRAIHLGVDPSFCRYDDRRAEQLRRQYCLPSRFILNVATIEPRKNLMSLLDAYSIYKLRAADPLPLILIGKPGYRSEEIRSRAEDADLSTHVRFLGYIPEPDLVQLMGLAVCMVFPSVYEGFGLPVLEAMATGCPVIASNRSALPEVTGEAAKLVDPDDCLALSHMIETVTGHAELRRRMSIAGKMRAEQFSWEKMAQQYLDVFDAAMRIHRNTRMSE